MRQKKFEQHHGFKLEEITIEDEFFTKERIKDWRRLISECCRDVCVGLFNYLDVTSGISYFVNKALIDEAVFDAIIGLKKIINSTPNPVVKPNAFKISAYLSYWLLRHKPVSLLFNIKKEDDGKKVFIDFKDLVIPKSSEIDKKSLVWQLNHINEIIAVSFATSFIFDFEEVICDDNRCKYIIANNTSKDKKECYFSFNSFNEQRKFMIEKLTYYFAYRAIAPKIIEHILEGYSFHPAWKLTGAHWKTET